MATERPDDIVVFDTMAECIGHISVMAAKMEAKRREADMKALARLIANEIVRVRAD